MNRIAGIVMLGASALACGCCCIGTGAPKVDAEGFTYTDGRRVETTSPGEYYVIRYEYPTDEKFTGGRTALQKWNFTPRPPLPRRRRFSRKSTSWFPPG